MSSRTKGSAGRAAGRAAPVGTRRTAADRRPPAWLIPLGIGLLHVVLALLIFDPTPFTGGDNAAYISLGRSLLERGAYLELWDPALGPHTKYPPVLPSVLALAMAVGVRPWVGLKLLIIGFSTAAVVFTYVWTERRSGRMLALGVATLLAVSPGVLQLTHAVLSDVPFWAFTMLALWGWQDLEPRERGRFAVAVAAVVLAYFTRSAGLPLVVAVFGWLGLRRQWRALAVVAAVIVPLGLAWWLRSRLGGGVAYVGEFWMVNPYRPELGRIGFGDLGLRMAENGWRYALLHLPVLLTGGLGRAAIAIAVVTALAGIAGWAMRLRDPGLAELFLPLYIGLLLVWPQVWSGERFLLPALPLILVYAAEALRAGAEWFRPASARWVGAVAVAVVILAGVPRLTAEVRLGRACSAAYRQGARYPCLAQPWQDLFAAADWSRAALPEDAVVLSRKPRLFYALSGLRGRIYPFSPEPAALFAAADSAGARYVVMDYVSGLSSRYLASALVQRPAAFCVLHAFGPGRAAVLGILPGAAEMAATDTDARSARLSPCPAGYLRSNDEGGRD